MQELSLLKNQLHNINGQPILTSKTGVCLNEILRKISNSSNKIITDQEVLSRLPHPRSGLIPPSIRETDMKVFASDSSDHTEFTYNVEKPGQVYFAEMSNEDKELSSGHRELKSVSNSVLNHPEYFESTKPVKLYWIVDSQNLYSWLKRGSRKIPVQKDLFQLFLRLTHLNVIIEPILVPRDHEAIVQADFAGKFKNTDGWSIDDVSFQTLQTIAGSSFTCDVFAHSSNNRCEKFYSLIPSLGTSGVNAFSMDWSQDNNFICPPVKEIIFVIRHISLNPCKGVIVVPHLESSRFWHFLIDKDGSFISIIKKTFIFCPDLHGGFQCDRSSFHGPFHQHNKKFIALFFNSM